jgi:hypothetical protein
MLPDVGELVHGPASLSAGAVLPAGVPLPAADVGLCADCVFVADGRAGAQRTADELAALPLIGSHAQMRLPRAAIVTKRGSPRFLSVAARSLPAGKFSRSSQADVASQWRFG